MGVVAIANLCFCRQGYDSMDMMIVEVLIGFILVMAARWCGRQDSDSRRSTGTVSRLGAVLVVLVLMLPWVIDMIARRMGYGNGIEIVLLCGLAWGSLIAAAIGSNSRTLGLSVVCSGFLTLFTTFISDSAWATIFAYGWSVICLWWLVTNHWIHIETYQAVDIRLSRTRRFGSIAVGLIALLVATGVVADRIPVVHQLATEIMPTSGGTGNRDDAARHGVGDGEMLIAAQEHATSFGAVETDVFLDSQKPSLFDVFSDEFGEPVRKRTVERTQALNVEISESEDNKASEGQQSPSGESFETERKRPRERRPTNDLKSEALMFWTGQSGIRLAVERYDQFDGWKWTRGDKDTSKKASNLPVTQATGDQRTWFRYPHRTLGGSLSPYVGAMPEAIKFTGYRSPIIPTRLGLQLWSIDRLENPEFFACESNDVLSMPGREHVPDYTVVRLVDAKLDAERVESMMKTCAQSSKSVESYVSLPTTCLEQIQDLSTTCAGESEIGWPQVTWVINHLRSNYQLTKAPASADVMKATSKAVATIAIHEDLVQATPLERFLETREGPDYLFATAAAVMLDQLGYKTRIAVGFYVDPERQVGKGEFAILADDAHVWTEIHVGHGYWIPLEASPGYLPPPTTAALWYRLKQQKQKIAAGLIFVLMFGFGSWLLRRRLFEVGCIFSLPMIWLVNDRTRISLLAKLLDARLRLAGQARPAGMVMRDRFAQLRSIHQSSAVQLSTFFDEADALMFGDAGVISHEGRKAINGLWTGLTVMLIRRSCVAEQNHGGSR